MQDLVRPASAGSPVTGHEPTRYSGYWRQVHTQVCVICGYLMITAGSSDGMNRIDGMMTAGGRSGIGDGETGTGSVRGACPPFVSPDSAGAALMAPDCPSDLVSTFGVRQALAAFTCREATLLPLARTARVAPRQVNGARARRSSESPQSAQSAVTSANRKSEIDKLVRLWRAPIPSPSANRKSTIPSPSANRQSAIGNRQFPLPR